jgi:hypothetical protein
MSAHHGYPVTTAEKCEGCNKPKWMLLAVVGTTKHWFRNRLKLTLVPLTVETVRGKEHPVYAPLCKQCRRVTKGISNEPQQREAALPSGEN